MDTPIVPQKRCSTCKLLFPATSECFHKNKNTKDGLSARCKSCACKITSQWRKKNPDRAVQWRTDHPEYQKAWYQENKEIHLRRTKSRYDANPQRKLASNEAWRVRNPERRKKISRLATERRRTRKHALPNTFTVDQWEKCLSWWEYRCCYCGNPRDLWHTLEADHFIPLTSPDCPGTIQENIVPSCKSCNSRKKHHPSAEWLIRWQGKRKASIIMKRIEEYFEWVSIV